MRWLIAAGGTGGHIFPALSVALAVRERLQDAQVTFVGAKGGMENRLVPSRGFRLRAVRAHGLIGLRWRRRLRTLFVLPWTITQCVVILLSCRPHFVLGMGGFAAGPVVMVAALFGRYTAIAEQNAVAGRTNRILGRFVRRIFLAFKEAAGSFPTHKVRVTGNPIRPELVERAGRILPQYWEGRPGETFHLLIFGGSQGARNINLFVMEALPWLAEIPYALEVLHQTGAKLVDELREAYAARGMPHSVVAFIEEMDQAYQWAHLILCRAGATSLAEIALFRKPSILIPFPHATDDHQEHNAGVFESAGAAVILKEEGLNGRRLAEVVRDLAQDPKRLRAMGEQAMRLARPDAASRIVQECLALLGEGAWDG